MAFYFNVMLLAIVSLTQEDILYVQYFIGLYLIDELHDKKNKKWRFFSRQVQSSCERPITLTKPKVACDDDNNDVDNDDNDTHW